MSPWFPGLARSWGTAPIKHLAIRVTDGAHISPDTDGGEFPFVSTRDLRDGRIDINSALRTSRETYDYMVRTGCQPWAGDILFSKDGTVGETALVPEGQSFVVASSLVIISPDRAKCDPRYLNHALGSRPVSEQAASFKRGTGLPRLSVGNLGRLVVPVPSLADQRTIADYLDRETARIDSLIEEQQRLIEMLEARKRAVLDEVTTSAEGQRIRLKFLFAPSSEANHPDEEVLSVYRDFGVIPKSSRNDNFNRTPENVERYLLVRPGDLVINRMKAWQGSLGVSEYRGIVSGDYEVVRPSDDCLLPRFSHLYLRSPRMIAEYVVRSTGIRPSQWRLYWDQMGNIEVPVPTLAQQDCIANRIDEQTAKIDALIAETETFIELSRERRSALITAAVTGQIDVRGVA